MGIRPGEVVTRANGQAVYNTTDLYAALQLSPAFCKLEVVDGDNERRIVQRSLYADEPHQLGLVPVEEFTPGSGAVLAPLRMVDTVHGPYQLPGQRGEERTGRVANDPDNGMVIV